LNFCVPFSAANKANNKKQKTKFSSVNQTAICVSACNMEQKKIRLLLGVAGDFWIKFVSY
jgi:hypothetical protein